MYLNLIDNYLGFRKKKLPFALTPRWYSGVNAALRISLPFALSLSKGFFLFIFFTSYLSATERISLFESDITVNTDGTLLVREKIKVQAQGEQIKRGIVREFPTTYPDRWGNNVTVQFIVTDVQRDGHQEPYRITDALDGKKVFIGDADTYLRPGNYTYLISYKTNRQIGFFDNHDELYFNVTGNGWRLPIEHARAIVHLPPGIVRDQLQLEAYTGYKGAQSHYAVYEIMPDGSLVFETTQPLNVYQGLTIVAGWPKNYVTQPTLWQELRWFFQDNFAVLIALLGLLIELFYFLFVWRRAKAREGRKAVIPLFYPPEGMTAGAVRYIVAMGYDSKALAADVVQMAVDGYVTIEQSKMFSWSPGYTLHKKQEPKKDYVHSGLFQKLLGSADSVALANSNQKLLSSVYQQEEQHYKKAYGSLLVSHAKEVAVGYFIVIGFALATFFSQAHYESSFFSWLLIFALFGIAFLFTWLLRSYTDQGLVLKREIDGFKMFLMATEKDRFDIIGTPPTKTPELYEHYLPYAIALGVEKQWSKQFAPIFELMKEQGNPYVMGWYMGHSFDRFNASSFASTMGSSINSAISSSGIKPGSSSGFGGKGSSGGGGGGGGGGGW